MEALVHSQLDYGHGVLVGLPAYLTCRLQSVLNAAARLIYRLRICDHIYDTIRYDTRCYFNVRSKADISQLNLPHGTDI